MYPIRLATRTGRARAYNRPVQPENATPEFRNEAGLNLSPLAEIREIVAYSHLLRSLVVRDLTVRYKRSALGFLWTMLHPLLLMAILAVVFSHFFRFAIEHYETYFLAAFLPWTFFQQSTVTAMSSLAWNGGLMKKVRVPKAIFAVSTTASGLANLALSLIPLFAIMLAVGAPLRPSVLFLPVAFALLAVFTLGVALGLSAVAVYFDDVAQMYQVLVTGLMYLTPIMYPLSIVPEKYVWLVKANPLYHLIELCRAPVYAGTIPHLRAVGLAASMAAASLLCGWVVFRRLSRGFYLHL